MVKYRFNSVIVFEQEVIDGVPQSPKIISKFVTEKKIQKEKYGRKKKAPVQFTDSGEAEVETR